MAEAGSLNSQQREGVWQRVSATMCGRGTPEDPFRRAGNERATTAELVNWRTVCVLTMVLVVGRSWLQQGLPVVALVQASHALLALGLILLIRRRRHVYVRHRELITTAAVIHCGLVTLYAALNGTTCILEAHGGRPLRLLILLQLISPGPWQALYILSGNLVLSWNYLALPLVALPQLLASEAMCTRLLLIPDIQAPLDSMYSLLSITHSIRGGLTWADLLPGRGTGAPLQQCMCINVWAALNFIVALPLFVQRRTERHARRLFADRALSRSQQEQEQERQLQQQRGVTAGSSMLRQLDQLRDNQQRRQQQQRRRQIRRQQASQPGRLLAKTCLELYLVSCLVWSISAALLQLLALRS